METINLARAFRDYSKQTDVRSLLYAEMYINSDRLVKGNSKLHNILIFDLPSVKTCLNCDDCKDKCYAKKAEVQYADTEIYRQTNYHLFLNKPELLKQLIVEQLTNTKMSVVRIHSSGDFFSQSYIDFWNDIIAMFPSIQFYVYTKVDSILDFTAIKQNSNFNLISSFINGKLNFGSIDYCNELKAEHKAFICPVTSGKDIKCGLQCKYCITKNNVCFVEH
jgi:ferredoxin